MVVANYLVEKSTYGLLLPEVHQRDANPDLARERLTRLLRPAGIAVIGASEQESSLGSRYLGGILRHSFPGPVYPVNPKYESLMGRACYGSILDAPDPLDAAVLCVRAELVESTLIDCAARGIGGVVVFAGGYRETGPDGAALERRLTALASALGIRVMGPNSPGFINFVDRAVVTATSVAFRESFPDGGRLGVVAQSGGVAGIIAERAMDRGLGLSYMLCSGNEADFDTPEAIEFLADDAHTDAIAVYYEGVADTDRLAAAWRTAAQRGKPVVVFTPGGSEASSRAAASHTGSRVGEDDALMNLADRLGVVRVLDLDELLQTASALPRLPRGDNDRVLLLTTSGGGGVLAADAIGRIGARLPELSAELQTELGRTLRAIGTFSNPVDMTSDPVQNPPSFRKSIEIVCRSTDHDVVVMALTVQAPRLAQAMAETIASSPDARGGRLVVLWYAGAMSDEARRFLRAEGVTVFDTPRALAVALAAAKTWNGRHAASPDAV